MPVGFCTWLADLGRAGFSDLTADYCVMQYPGIDRTGGWPPQLEHAGQVHQYLDPFIDSRLVGLFQMPHGDDRGQVALVLAGPSWCTPWNSTREASIEELRGHLAFCL